MFQWELFKVEKSSPQTVQSKRELTGCGRWKDGGDVWGGKFERERPVATLGARAQHSCTRPTPGATVLVKNISRGPAGRGHWLHPASITRVAGQPGETARAAPPAPGPSRAQLSSHTFTAGHRCHKTISWPHRGESSKKHIHKSPPVPPTPQFLPKKAQGGFPRAIGVRKGQPRVKGGGCFAGGAPGGYPTQLA